MKLDALLGLQAEPTTFAVVQRGLDRAMDSCIQRPTYRQIVSRRVQSGATVSADPLLCEPYHCRDRRDWLLSSSKPFAWAPGLVF